MGFHQHFARPDYLGSTDHVRRIEFGAFLRTNRGNSATASLDEDPYRVAIVYCTSGTSEVGWPADGSGVGGKRITGRLISGEAHCHHSICFVAQQPFRPLLPWFGNPIER
jgi:hypothetical protein